MWPMFSKTFSSLMFSYGCSLAKVRISQRVTAKDQTSLFDENLPCECLKIKLSPVWISSLVHHCTYHESTLPGHPPNRHGLRLSSCALQMYIIGRILCSIDNRSEGADLHFQLWSNDAAPGIHQKRDPKK